MTTQPRLIEYSEWSDWEPKEYLSEYYATVMPDERYAMEFLVESLRGVPEADCALDFGAGPTVHHAFPLVTKAKEVHLAEFLPGNRDEIESWLRHDPDSHNWLSFAQETLKVEGNPHPTVIEALERERATRECVTRVVAADAGETDPLGPSMRGYYPLVTSHYCAEGATNDKATWRRYMRNIAGLVRAEGTLILSACGAADYYCIGERRFPCAGVNGHDLLDSLAENGFGDVTLRIRQVPDHSEQGYGSVLFACAVKRA